MPFLSNTLCTGDLKNEDSVLEWLSDDDNRELADEIEAVNSRMLERLLDESPFLAVYYRKYLLCLILTVTCEGVIHIFKTTAIRFHASIYGSFQPLRQSHICTANLSLTSLSLTYYSSMC